MTRRSPRLPLGYRLAEFTRPAERSCRSFAATSTTSWSQPLRTGTLILQARRADRQERRVHRLAGRRPVCRGIGKRSASAIWSSQAESREDGWYEAIVVEANGDMFTLRWRDYPRERRIVRHRLRLGLLYPRAKPTAETREISESPQPRQNTTNPSRQIPPPTPNRCPKIGTTSISIISCWPKPRADGRRGGKPSWSRPLMICSSCAGATMRQHPADHAATARLGADLPRRSVTANLDSSGLQQARASHLAQSADAAMT